MSQVEFQGLHENTQKQFDPLRKSQLLREFDTILH